LISHGGQRTGAGPAAAMPLDRVLDGSWLPARHESQLVGDDSVLALEGTIDDPHLAELWRLQWRYRVAVAPDRDARYWSPMAPAAIARRYREVVRERIG